MPAAEPRGSGDGEPGVAATPRVAVVVLNWNGLEDTKEAVHSLLGQDYPNLKIHMVDNGSENHEADALAQAFDEAVSKGVVQLHRNPSNLGFTGGNHTGIRAALGNPDTQYVALLNNDAKAAPNWLSKLVECAETSPRIGAVAGTMVFHDRPEVIENTGVVLLHSGEAMPRQRGRPISEAAGAAHQPIGACAGAALYRAEMLREIGLFEEWFFANFEDVELSLRALATGWDIRFTPHALVRHKLSQSINRVRDREFMLRSQRNLLWGTATRLPWQAHLLNLPWWLLGNLVLIVVAPVFGQRLMAQVMLVSRWRFLRDLPAVLKERSNFRARRRGGWFRIWRRQSWFLPHYLRSFLDVVVLRRRSFFS